MVANAVKLFSRAFNGLTAMGVTLLPGFVKPVLRNSL
jgi:hypothetical protein